MKRNKQGQFSYKPFKHSNWSGLILLLSIMLVGGYLNYRFEPVELHRPIVGQVMAVERPPVFQVIKKTPVTVEEKVRAMFPEDPEMAVKIANCESHMRPTAFNPHNKNGSWDAGVMQINSVHKYSKEYLFNVDNNLKAARKLYDRSGWNPWSCYRKVK